MTEIAPAARAAAVVDRAARRLAGRRRGAESAGRERTRRPIPTRRTPWPATASGSRKRAARAGVDFVHQGPTFDRRLEHIMPQVASMGAAVAVADFDRDGWQDFYVTNSGEGSLNRLYRNNGNGTFSDVAAELGVADVNQAGTGVSMGAVWGDYDNDGYEDLFLYKYGRPELFHNDSGRGFTPVGRARRPAAMGQRQQRHLARLRPRRLARSLPRGLLAGGRRPLESEDDADHARELRVRRERRPEVPAPQPRRRHVRGDRRGRSGSARAAGRSPSRRPICWAPAIPDLFLRQRLRRLRALRQSGRQAVRRRRPRDRRRPHAQERDERRLRRHLQRRPAVDLQDEHLGAGRARAGQRSLGAEAGRGAAAARVREPGLEPGRGSRRLELGRAVRRPEQRRHARHLSGERLRLGRGPHAAIGTTSPRSPSATAPSSPTRELAAR